MLLKLRFPYICRTFATRKLTVSPEQVKHFDERAAEWWDLNGNFKALHSLNNTRIPWFINRLISTGLRTDSLKKLSVLDVGCGGGILTEALGRLGCNVVGLDASDELIKVAKHHAESQKIQNLYYECGTIQEHAVRNTEKYDIVISSETIEHVIEKELFVKSCTRCLKPGGSFFISTHNKTWLSGFFIIFVLEDLLKIVPKGTHAYDLFIHFNDLSKFLEKENCIILASDGMLYHPFRDEWHLRKSKNVTYCIHALKS